MRAHRRLRSSGYGILVHDGYRPWSVTSLTERAYPGRTGGTAEERRLRSLLREAMEAEGFTVYEYEWRHFDYQDWRRYRIAAVPFSAVR